MRRGFLVVPAMVMLSACVSTGPLDGGTAGGVSAPATSAGILEALNGGLIARMDADGLSRSDRDKALQAEYRALEYAAAGETVTWRGGRSLQGEVVAAQPYRVGSQDCRPYTHTVTFSAGPQTVQGTACRNPDGSWTPLT